MIKKVFGSFALAFENIRSNFLHTILSVLGIVIGVAALVAILSLIDGAEKFAKEQINTTTSLNAIIVHTETFTRMNNVRIPKDSFSVIDYAGFVELDNVLSKPADKYYRSSASDEVLLKGKDIRIGAVGWATNEFIAPDLKAITGKLFTNENIRNRDSIAIINQAFLNAVKGDSTSIIGQHIQFKNKTLRVTGVL